MSNEWLRGYPAHTRDAWFITLCGFDGTHVPPEASFLWPAGPELKIPNKMVLMTVAAYTDLLERARPMVAEDQTEAKS